MKNNKLKSSETPHAKQGLREKPKGHEVFTFL